MTDSPRERVARQMALFRELEAQAPPPRQRAPRRRTPKPEQLAILSPEEQERRERRAAQRQAYDKRRQCRPDGQPLPKGMSWCGRCGETVFAYSMVINHDLGYCGCPVEFDPVLKLKNGPGFRHGTPFNRDELNDRWDRQFFADCVCGDACGIHQPDGWCYAYCGCDEYRPSDV